MTSTTNTEGRKRSFKDSYRTADVAESYLIDLIENNNMEVDRYGIDRRNENLSEEEIDGSPDLKVTQDGNTLAYVESKAKQSSSWMLVTNEYAFERYVDFTDEHDVPVYIGWVHLDDTIGNSPLAVKGGASWEHLGNDTKTIHDLQFVPVQSKDQVERSWTARDGNRVVQLREEDAQSFDEFERRITGETET